MDSLWTVSDCKTENTKKFRHFECVWVCVAAYACACVIVREGKVITKKENEMGESVTESEKRLT